jgi:hypothetical protein
MKERFCTDFVIRQERAGKYDSRSGEYKLNVNSFNKKAGKAGRQKKNEMKCEGKS